MSLHYMYTIAERMGDLTVVRFRHDNVTSENVPAIEKEISQLVTQGCKLIVSFAGVEFVAHDMILSLMKMQSEKAAEVGGLFRCCCLGIDTIGNQFPLEWLNAIADSEREAIALIKQET